MIYLGLMGVLTSVGWWATWRPCLSIDITRSLKLKPKTPTQNAIFLQHVAAMEENSQQMFNNLQTPANSQSEFDAFYTTVLSLLNQYYTEWTTSITSRFPEYITPEIKAKLRHKNRLMRAGRVEEAAALAEHIGKDIAWRGKACLTRMNRKMEMWPAVWQLTGQWQEDGRQGDVASSVAADWSMTGSWSRSWSCTGITAEVIWLKSTKYSLIT